MRLKRSSTSSRPAKGSFGKPVRLTATAVLVALTSMGLMACGANAADVPSTSDGTSSSAAPEIQEVTYGAVSATATDWPIAAAKHLGLDEKHGLDVSVIYTGGVSASIQQLAAGALDVADSTIEQYIRSINQGIPAKMFAASVLPFPYVLVAKPEIKTLADLKGQTVIVAAEKDPTYYLTAAALEEVGVAPEDWTATYAGSTTNRYAALKSGGVAAAAVAPPFSFTALAEGYTTVLDLSQVDPNYGFTALGATDETLENDPEMIKAFAAMYGEANDWLLDPANRDRAIEILMEDAKSSLEDTEKTYDLYMTQLKAFAPQATLPDRYVDGVQTQLVNLGDQPQMNEISKYVWTAEK